MGDFEIIKNTAQMEGIGKVLNEASAQPTGKVSCFKGLFGRKTYHVHVDDQHSFKVTEKEARQCLEKVTPREQLPDSKKLETQSSHRSRIQLTLAKVEEKSGIIDTNLRSELKNVGIVAKQLTQNIFQPSKAKQEGITPSDYFIKTTNEMIDSFQKKFDVKEFREGLFEEQKALADTLHKKGQLTRAEEGQYDSAQSVVIILQQTTIADDDKLIDYMTNPKNKVPLEHLSSEKFKDQIAALQEIKEFRRNK